MVDERMHAPLPPKNTHPHPQTDRQTDTLTHKNTHTTHAAEVWLERRSAYTRSLAVMSMAGYILGARFSSFFLFCCAMVFRFSPKASQVLFDNNDARTESSF